MSIRKRELHINRENFFKSKLVLDSLKSKIAFFVIVFMFGVVISIRVFDVVGNYGVNFGENVNRGGVVEQNELEQVIEVYYQGGTGIHKLSNAIAEHLNGCV